jgi:hypothetical protein
MKEESTDQLMLDDSEKLKHCHQSESVPINGYLSYIEEIKRYEKEQTISS